MGDKQTQAQSERETRDTPTLKLHLYEGVVNAGLLLGGVRARNYVCTHVTLKCAYAYVYADTRVPHSNTRSRIHVSRDNKLHQM